MSINPIGTPGALMTAAIMLATAAVPANAAPFTRNAHVLIESPSGVVIVSHKHKYAARHTVVKRSGRNVVVDAPTTTVETRGRRVAVDAPFAHVRRSSGGVHVRAPFVDLWVPRR